MAVDCMDAKVMLHFGPITVICARICDHDAKQKGTIGDFYRVHLKVIYESMVFKSKPMKVVHFNVGAVWGPCRGAVIMPQTRYTGC